LILFIGDFPYTGSGSRKQIRSGNRKIWDVVGFTQLTSSTPTYGIYDDHDFGKTVQFKFRRFCVLPKNL
jgi:hypothetical protein